MNLFPFFLSLSFVLFLLLFKTKIYKKNKEVHFLREQNLIRLLDLLFFNYSRSFLLIYASSKIFMSK